MSDSFSSRLENLFDWKPDNSCRNIFAIYARTEGEPLRIIVGRLPELEGNSVFSRSKYLEDKLDHIRNILMWEPRGHSDMYGCIVTLPFSKALELNLGQKINF